MVENNLEQYRKITKPFVVNKINKLLKEGGVPVEDFYVEEEMPKEKPEPQKQPILQNKVCKYERLCKNGKIINWNLFFDDHKELVWKKVYPYKKPNIIGVIKKLTEQQRGEKFGILFNEQEVRFSDFVKNNISSRPTATYNYIFFADTNKTIKQTYEELMNEGN